MLNWLWKLLKRFSQVLEIGYPNTKYQILSEAKASNYNFRLYQGSSIYVFAPSDVDVSYDKVTFSGEHGTFNLRYSQIDEIQPLINSGTVNVISVMWSKFVYLFVLAIPLILAAIVFTNSESLSKNKLISETIVSDWDMYDITRMIDSHSFDNPYYNGPEKEEIIPLLRPMLAKAIITSFGNAIFIVGYISLMLGFLVITRSIQGTRARAASEGRIHTVIKQLEQAKEEDEYFTKLINVNLSNIEAYYLLVKQQTDNSFRLTLASAIAGFIVLLSGILLSFQQGLSQPSVAITVASGALIEFISSIFFYVYSRTINQLNAYHDKLVDVQDTMLALKVSQGIKNDVKLKNQTLRYLTEALTNRLVRTNSKSEPSQPTSAAAHTEN